MPTAAIEIRRKYSPEEETALMAAIQTAMTATLKVPHWTTSIRLFVHEPHRFSGPPAPRENWAIRGGLPASEVELEYDVEI